MTRARSLALGAKAPWKQVRWSPFGGISASSHNEGLGRQAPRLGCLR